MDNNPVNKRALIIANPISGLGKAEKHLAPALNLLRSNGWQAEAVCTEGAGEAGKYAAAFTGELIISFGGDGTFNEILNGANLRKTSFAIIPGGTGNVLAKELRMPLNPVKAARAIAHGTARQYDVGNAGGRLFAFGCGIGLGAHIIRNLHHNRSGNITQMHYLPHLIRIIASIPSWKIQVTVDGKMHIDDANFVCVSNTKSYGGPIELTPLANPRDGWLDVSAAKLLSLHDIPAFAFAALTRSIHACRLAHCAQAQKIRLSSEQKNVPYHIDGDFAGLLPLTINLNPVPMRLITPPPSLARHPVIPV